MCSRICCVAGFLVFQILHLKDALILQKCKICNYRNPGVGFEQSLKIVFCSGNRVKDVEVELQMGMMRMLVMLALLVVLVLLVVMLVLVVLVEMLVVMMMIHIISILSMEVNGG